MAQTYVDTAGQINPRILVRGNAEAFKDTNHTNRIRACLFTGLQMAHLWRQLGGSSWNMILANVNCYRIFKHLLVYSTKLSKAVTRLFCFMFIPALRNRYERFNRTITIRWTLCQQM